MANTLSEIKDIGLIYVGKEICVDVYFDVDQDVSNAYVQLEVPPGVTYASSLIPRGTFNPISNTWNIGQVLGNESVLSGVVCFTVDDATYERFDFQITGGVTGYCEDCLSGNTRCVTYTGITCSEVAQCPSIGDITIYNGSAETTGDRTVETTVYTFDIDGVGVMQFGDVSGESTSTLIEIDQTSSTVTITNNLKLNTYGVGDNVDVATYLLGVTATGNVIEQSAADFAGNGIFDEDNDGENVAVLEVGLPENLTFFGTDSNNKIYVYRSNTSDTDEVPFTWIGGGEIYIQRLDDEDNKRNMYFGSDLQMGYNYNNTQSAPIIEIFRSNITAGVNDDTPDGQFFGGMSWSYWQSGAWERQWQRSYATLEDNANGYGNWRHIINGSTLFTLYNNATAPGDIRFNRYGAGNKTGTEVYGLGVDASGYVVETGLGAEAGTVRGVVTHSNFINQITTAEELILIDASTFATTSTLPDASTVSGYKWTFKVIDDTNGIFIDAQAGNIDGAIDYQGMTLYDSITVVSDGTNYHII